MMRAYLLQRVKTANWDEMAGFVIVASSEDEAREIASGNCGDEGPMTWKNEAETECRTVKSFSKKGVLIEDFKAG